MSERIFLALTGLVQSQCPFAVILMFLLLLVLESLVTRCGQSQDPWKFILVGLPGSIRSVRDDTIGGLRVSSIGENPDIGTAAPGSGRMPGGLQMFSGQPRLPVTISPGMGERRGLKYIWRTVPRAPQALFSSVRDVHPAMVQVMFSRGLEAPDLCADFLAGVCRDADDPHLLADVPRAVERLVRAQQRGEQVAVFTDYDADGVNSAAVLATGCAWSASSHASACRIASWTGTA